MRERHILGFCIVRRRRTRKAGNSAQYKKHKEAARALVHARLLHWNKFYGFTYNRVSIKDTCSRWGSCSKKNNLNFNYRLVLIAPDLADYVIVHELCHLKEFNHGERFWALVAEALPEYEALKRRLRATSMRVSS